jgi:hypothetical protein
MASGYVIEEMQANGKWYVRGDLLGTAIIYPTESAAYASREVRLCHRDLRRYRIVPR